MCGTYLLYASARWTSSLIVVTGVGMIAINSTMTPKMKSKRPMILTNMASPDHWPTTPAFWRNVSFSRNPSSAVARAST